MMHDVSGVSFTLVGVSFHACLAMAPTSEQKWNGLVNFLYVLVLGTLY